jgi:hypothetical protein
MQWSEIRKYALHTLIWPSNDLNMWTWHGEQMYEKELNEAKRLNHMNYILIFILQE